MSQKPEFAVIDAPAKVFKFKLADSDELYQLPTVGSLPMDDWMKMQGDAHAEIEANLALFDEHCPGLRSKLTLDDYNGIIRAWYKASGITLGE